MICRVDQGLLEFFRTVYVPESLGISPGTIEQHEITIRLFSRWLDRPALVSDLTRERMLGFLSWFSTQRAPSTVNSKRSKLLALANMAWGIDLLVEQPRRVVRIRQPRRLPTAWSIEELAQLWRSITSLAGAYRIDATKLIPRSLAWSVAYSICLDTAIRRGTLLKARLDQVDPVRRLLVVPAEQIKGQAGDRVFPLSQATVDLVLKRAHYGGRMLFPFPFGLTALGKHYKAILRRAGLPCGRERMLHCLRRTIETHAAARLGVDVVAAIVGHRPEVARRSYIDPRIMAPQSICDVLPLPMIEQSQQLRLFEA